MAGEKNHLEVLQMSFANLSLTSLYKQLETYTNPQRATLL